MIYKNAKVIIIKPKFVDGEYVEIEVGRGITLWEDEYPEEDDRRAIPYWRVRWEDGKETNTKERFLRIDWEK
jgi:hypothetical protein